MVGGETSRASAGLGVQLCRPPNQVRALLVGQQAGDGLNDGAHKLAVAEVTGQCPPVLQMGDAVLDADTPGGVGLALPFVDSHSSYQSGSFFLTLGAVAAPYVRRSGRRVLGSRRRQGSPRPGRRPGV